MDKDIKVVVAVVAIALVAVAAYELYVLVSTDPEFRPAVDDLDEYGGTIYYKSNGEKGTFTVLYKSDCSLHGHTIVVSGWQDARISTSSVYQILINNGNPHRVYTFRG